MVMVIKMVSRTLVSSSNSVGKCSFVSRMRGESWKLHERKIREIVPRIRNRVSRSRGPMFSRP